jgi:flotillin
MAELSSSVWVLAGLAVVAVILLMGLVARMYRKAGPHEALIVYGFRGTRIIKGG